MCRQRVLDKSRPGALEPDEPPLMVSAYGAIRGQRTPARLFFSSMNPAKGSRLSLRTHDEGSSKTDSLGQAVLAANLYQPIALDFC